MSNAYNVHVILRNLNRDDFFKVVKIIGYKGKYNIRRHDFIINILCELQGRWYFVKI